MRLLRHREVRDIFQAVYTVSVAVWTGSRQANS